MDRIRLASLLLLALPLAACGNKGPLTLPNAPVDAATAPAAPASTAPAEPATTPAPDAAPMPPTDAPAPDAPATPAGAGHG